MKKIFQIIVLFGLLFTVASCGRQTEEYKPYKIDQEYLETETITNYVLLEMEKKDQILIELYPDIAPITVANFQKLVAQGYYDGLIFHRVIANFMIQTGDPTGTGTGGSEETIKGEFELNDVENNLMHEQGVVSMARKGAPYGEEETEEHWNSASSQFFIVHKTNENSTYLDGKYAAFGKVIAGLDTVNKIATTKTDANDLPVTEQKISKIKFVELKEN